MYVKLTFKKIEKEIYTNYLYINNFVFDFQLCLTEDCV